MYHPLLPDITKIKNEDLEKKINELTQKYFIASRSGQGAVCSQLILILEEYREEQHRRQSTAGKTANDRHGNQFDDFINIDS